MGDTGADGTRYYAWRCSDAHKHGASPANSGIDFRTRIVERGDSTYLKKTARQKIFRSTPIHHHFEAIGWSEPKIVMRAWVIAAMSAVVGVAVALLDVGL